MEKIKLQVSGSQIQVVARPAAITAGTVGLEAEFSFDSHWDNLGKTVIFRAGDKVITSALEGNTHTVPWEVLEKPDLWLIVGIYGANPEGTVVIPTLWTKVAAVYTGVDPEGDPALEPSNPIWQETLVRVANMEPQLREHIINKANPHGVTCGQLGAVTQKEFRDVISNLDGSSGDTGQLIPHLLNRNNPHGVTAAQVGAAPAGYGLGSSKWLNSKKDADGNEIGGWNLALQSGFYSSDANCPPKGTSSYMGIVTTFSPGTGIQIAWQAYPSGNKNVVFMRVFVNNEFRKWEEWSPSAFAPAGYGYGGEIPGLIEVDSDDALKTALDGLLANMPDSSARNVRVKHKGASVENGVGTMGGQGTLFGSLYKHSANYAILRVFGYLGTCFSLVKCESWGEVEWVNPPMAGGVEYRTTERFGGKPVYAYAIGTGYLPNAETKTVTHNIANISAVLSIYGIATDGRTIPYKNGNESIEVAADRTNIYVTTTTDMRAQSGTVCMKYIKTTD